MPSRVAARVQVSQQGLQLGDVVGGVLGVPLDADDGCVGRFDGLDGAVGRVGAHAQRLTQAIHALVVGRGNGDLGVDEDGGQGSLEMGTGLDAHAVAHESVIGEDRAIGVCAVCDVLLEGAAKRGVDDLHAATDAQQRRTGAGSVVDEGKLSQIGAVPVASLVVVSLGCTVVGGVNVLAAHDDDGVGPLGAQRGPLGPVFLRVFADNVPGGQRGLEKTIPQAHADVVVCLVPRARRKDVGDQQRRLRVVRHRAYLGRCGPSARATFTGWPIVTARIHVAGTPLIGPFS